MELQYPKKVIEYYSEKSLSSCQVKEGLDFIHRRFLEEWGIRRVDVTYDLILKRKNIILKDKSKVIGWLGIEDDGELTNACIEKGYKGTKNLIKLILKAYDMVPKTYLYADVPICKAASARAFLTTGMRLEEKPIKLIKLVYQERDIVLVKLSIEKTGHKDFNPDNLKRDLQTIANLNINYDTIFASEIKNSKYEFTIKQLGERKKP